MPAMMGSKLATVLLAFALGICAQDTSTSLKEVKKSFDDAKIPVDTFITFEPTALLQVTYPQDDGSGVIVKSGALLTRNQTAIGPVYDIKPVGSIARACVKNATFVVAMVDLDPPTPQAPTLAQIRHFLGGNFAADSPDMRGFARLTNSTPAITDYRRPSPPQGSDPHRYVFLLYSQPTGFNSQTLVTANTTVRGFNISDFAEVVGLGNPIGGSFMLVGPDAPTE